MKTRVENISGQNIYIVDDIFSKEEIDAFYEYVAELPFVRKEKSIAGDPFPIFSADFETVPFEEQTYVGRKAKELLQEFIPDADKYRLFRAYVNLSTYGDVEYPHYDCDAVKQDITVLYYVNNQWARQYGGETMFYEDHDSRLAVLPTPGRFVLFPGNIEHMGGVASRICKFPRYSLALKYTNS